MTDDTSPRGLQIRSRRNAVGAYGISLLTLASVPVLQFGSFLLSGQMLGLNEFGNLILFQASAAVMLEVAGGGMGEVLIRSTARDPKSLPQSLADFTAVMIPSTLIAVSCNALIQATIFGASELFLIGSLFGLFEIITQRTTILWEQVAIAHGHTKRADLFRFFPALARLLGLLIVFSSQFHFLTAITGVYVASGLISAAGVAAIGLNTYGRGKGNGSFGSYRLGLPFALNQLLRGIQYNLDRIVLKAVLSSSDVALYATAMKFVQVGLLPVSTMLRMWYPKIFAAGHQSLHELGKLSMRLLPLALAAAVIPCLALVLFAPLLPVLMGNTFTPAIGLLQLGAPAIVLVAVGYLGADILTGTGRQFLRVAFFTAAITAQVGVTIAAAPAVGPVAAVAGFYVSAAVLGALSWIAVAQLRRKGET